MGGECGVASFLLFSEEAPACPEVGAKQCLVSHLVPAVLGAQSHRTVGGGVWENVWDVEVKTLQDICGLHLPRDGGQAGESWAPPLPAPAGSQPPASAAGVQGSPSLRGKCSPLHPWEPGLLGSFLCSAPKPVSCVCSLIPEPRHSWSDSYLCLQGLA